MPDLEVLIARAAVARTEMRVADEKAKEAANEADEARDRHRAAQNELHEEIDARLNKLDPQ